MSKKSSKKILSSSMSKEFDGAVVIGIKKDFGLTKVSIFCDEEEVESTDIFPLLTSILDRMEDGSFSTLPVKESS